MRTLLPTTLIAVTLLMTAAVQAGPYSPGKGGLPEAGAIDAGIAGFVGPDGEGSVFIELPLGSVGNGICFDRGGDMYIADYTNHNVLRVDMDTLAISVYAHDPSLNQPNDLAIDVDDTLYASDPNWAADVGHPRCPPA